MRSLAFLTLAIVVSAQDCLAQTSAERQAFVAAYRCDVEEMLATVAKSSKRTDRYVVLALREDQGRYAQCLLGNGKGDSDSLCEVASGAFSFEQTPIVAAPERVAALRGLGFTIRKGSNYYRVVRVKNGDTRPLAQLLLAALSVAYGAKVGTSVLATASVAHADRREVRAVKSCAPMS
jgi:hypothetical protein